MIDPTVRQCRASEADVAQLVFLEQEARAALVGQRGGDRWLAEHPPIGGEWGLECARADVWLAHIDEVVVGYLVAQVGDDLIVRVKQVWVTPLAREVGFGDTLLEHAIASARQRGATGVEGESLPGDRQTKNLYERAGIVARLITTYRDL